VSDTATEQSMNMDDLIRDVRIFMANRGWHLDSAAIASEGLVLRVSLAEGVAE